MLDLDGVTPLRPPQGGKATRNAKRPHGNPNSY